MSIVISLVLALVVFVSYQTYVFVNFGILKSISISYYSIKPRWIFQVFIFTIALTMGYGGNTPLFYLSGLLLCGVAVTPTVNDEKLFPVHLTCAVLSILIAFVSMYLEYRNMMIYPMILFLTSSIIVYFAYRKHFILWVEIYSFVTIISVKLTLATLSI